MSNRDLCSFRRLAEALAVSVLLSLMGASVVAAQDTEAGGASWRVLEDEVAPSPPIPHRSEGHHFRLDIDLIATGGIAFSIGDGFMPSGQIGGRYVGSEGNGVFLLGSFSADDAAMALLGETGYARRIAITGNLQEGLALWFTPGIAFGDAPMGSIRSSQTLSVIGISVGASLDYAFHGIRTWDRVTHPRVGWIFRSGNGLRRFLLDHAAYRLRVLALSACLKV